MNLSELAQTYQARIHRFQTEKEQLERRSNRIVAARLMVFLLIVVLVFLAIKLKLPVILIISIIPLAGFFWLIQKAGHVRRAINYRKILIRINEAEQLALQGDHTSFDPGSHWIDFHHEYSYDLDIFGEHSIYRMVNRTGTPQGSETLAALLMNPGTDHLLIRQRQEAAKELKERLSWRQDFLATARESNWEDAQNQNARSWLQTTDSFSNHRFYPAAIRLNACITGIIVLANIFTSLLPSTVAAWCPRAFLYFILPIGLIISKTRTINHEQQKLDHLLGLFRKYAGLLALIETEHFNSPYLNRLQQKLEHENQRSSQIMKQLTGILWGLEARGNLIVNFLLNASLLWDILLMIRLERWRSRYRESFDRWIQAIADFEAINSLATLAFNRPDCTWPEILDGPFRMDIEAGGHPMIHPSKRVDNSMTFSENGQIYLITGANMAGKSTFLRMAGVNMILAMAGGPVCARRLALVPIPIFTSVRTNDSLGDDESYFYAELKRLSRIMNRFEQGDQLFVIIDEMLRGTNSRDKHAGSAALIKRLIQQHASGLVATHDIELGKLADDYPHQLDNRCFEVITEGNTLKFDYILHAGISQNLNATFLMRQMGIIKA